MVNLEKRVGFLPCVVFLDKTNILTVQERVRGRARHAAMDYPSWPEKKYIWSIITMQFSFSKEKQLQCATKVLRLLAVKFDFLRLGTFPPKQCDFIFFLRLHRPQRLHNTKLGGGEQVLKYRKAFFPKIVSITFVAHCLEAIYANVAISFIEYPGSSKFMFTKATKCVVQSDS